MHLLENGSNHHYVVCTQLCFSVFCRDCSSMTPFACMSNPCVLQTASTSMSTSLSLSNHPSASSPPPPSAVSPQDGTTVDRFLSNANLRDFFFVLTTSLDANDTVRHSFIPYTPSFAHWLTHSFTHSFAHWLTHSRTHSFAHRVSHGSLLSPARPLLVEQPGVLMFPAQHARGIAHGIAG